MLISARDLLIRIAVRLVAASTRASALLLTTVLIATAGLLYYTAGHLAIRTDTEEMLDPSLPFLQRERAMDTAFPQLTNLIVVVVEAHGPGQAQDSADRVADRLRERPDIVQAVFQPGGGEFFQKNGLLYLSADELWDLNDRMAAAQPFLGAMTHDPTLRGFFTMLSRALDEDLSPENQKLLAGIFDRLSSAVEAQASGHPQPIAWQDAWLEGDTPGPGVARSFVLVQPKLDYSTFEPAKTALAFVRETARDPKVAPAGGQIRITGSIAMESEELVNVAQDAKFTTSLSFLLVIGVLFWSLRSPRMVMAVLATLAVGLIWSGAFAAAAIGTLNLISVNFAVLFIGLGVDFGIQLAMRYREELQRGSLDVGETLRRAAAGVGGALALAAIIASVSFLALAPTDYRGLAELGIIAAMSMLIALLSSLTVLPAMLQVLPGRNDAPLPTGRVSTRLGELIVNHRVLVLAVALAITVGAAMLGPRARFDFNPLNLRDPTTESVATFKALLGDSGTSPYIIEVLAPNLHAAETLAQRLKAVATVDKVLTLASYVPEDQEEKLEAIADMNVVLQPLLTSGAPAATPTLEEQQAAMEGFQQALARARDLHAEGPLSASLGRLGQALMALRAGPVWNADTLRQLEADVVGDFPQLSARLRKLLGAEAITLESLPEILRNRYVSADGRARIEVFPAEDLNDNEALRRFAREVQAVAPTASGSPVALVEGGAVVIDACAKAAVLALGATLLVTLVVLGSVSATVLALLPLPLAMNLTVASSALFDLPFNLANIIALPLLIGLANAYGIYFVMRSRDNSDVRDLFRGSTPRAVAFSGLTTIASFGTLALARHPGMAHMGILVTLSLSYALVFTELVLPAIMALRSPSGSRDSTTNS